MKVRYSLIDCGKVLSSQVLEYDGSYEQNKKQIEDDQEDVINFPRWVDAEIIDHG